MMRRLLGFVALISSGALASQPGDIAIQHPLYGVVLSDSTARLGVVGFFGIYTGSAHPVTAMLDRPGDIASIIPDCFRCPGPGALSNISVRSFDSDTDYLFVDLSRFGLGGADGYGCTAAASPFPARVSEVPSGGVPVGVVGDWILAENGDALVGHVILIVHGSDLLGAYVELRVVVENFGTTSARVGIRDVVMPRATSAITASNPFGTGTQAHFFTGFRPPDPPLEPFIETEVERAWPSERMWQLHSRFSTPSTDPWLYSIAGTIHQPIGLAEHVDPPELLQVAASNRFHLEALGGIMDRCFEWHVPDPPRVVPWGIREQMALSYTWGLTEATALEIPPGGEVGVSQYLVAFIDYPLSATTEGPFVADCEGMTTRVPVRGAAVPIEPTSAPTVYLWSSPDPRVSFEDAGAASTYAIVQGAGTFPVELRTGIGVYEASAQTTVTVIDSDPPRIDNLRVMPTALWPPNHRMVPVRVLVHATDDCDPAPQLRLVSVTSSEPDEARRGGDGNTTGDIEGAELGTDDREVLLRAERSGRGVGRTYTLTYEASDASGNTARSSVDVRVEHDASRRPRSPRP